MQFIKYKVCRKRKKMYFCIDNNFPIKVEVLSLNIYHWHTTVYKLFFI